MKRSIRSTQEAESVGQHESSALHSSLKLKTNNDRAFSSGSFPHPNSNLSNSIVTKLDAAGLTREETAFIRHILVDTLGLILAVVVHTAATQNRAGAVQLLNKAHKLERCASLSKIWADGAYSGENLQVSVTEYGWSIEKISRSNKQKGFVVLAKRWAACRTFGWFNRFRRLSEADKRKAATAEAFIFVIMSRLLLTRLQPPIS